MVRITDLNAISEYRKRRSARIDSKNWIDELNLGGVSGEVKPTVAEVEKTPVVFYGLSRDMKPSREYRFLNDGEIMDYSDWLKVNKKALKPVYSDGGLDAVEWEYYKGLLVNATRGLKRIQSEEVHEQIDKRLSEDYLGMPSDEQYRREMIRSLIGDRDGRNAALNQMYDNYCLIVNGCKSFEDFLNTPVKVYKVGSGDIYSSYIFGDGEGRDELLIRPIDTFGCIRYGANGAVMVPNWRTNGEPVRDVDEWKWRKKQKWVFEEKEEDPPELEIIGSIENEAEMIKLFEDDKSDVGMVVVDRCVDSIQRLIKRLVMRATDVHTDSAFFSGELNDILGERNVLYPEIDEFRERRQKRLDAKFEESKHPRGKDGKFTSGSGESVGLSQELKPANSDYDYDSSDDFMQFVHKNVEKTRQIYKENGMNGVEDEWFKTRLADCTKDLKPISDDEIDSALEDNIDRGVARLWLREYNNDVKDKLVAQMTNNPEVHNAALNVMYKNYVDSVERNGNGKPLSFEEFLVTPIKMYRGGSGKEYKKAGAFSSYTFSEEVASRFKNGPTGHEPEKDGVIYEAEIRPIDTYGSLNTSGEAEIFVPRMIAPNGRRDAVEDYRKRRQKRLDEKDEGQWITTENNHKVHLNEEGEPDKGNPHVIEKMESGEEKPSISVSDARDGNKIAARIKELKKNISYTKKDIEYYEKIVNGDNVKRYRKTREELKKLLNDELGEKTFEQVSEELNKKKENIKVLRDEKKWDEVAKLSREVYEDDIKMSKIKDALTRLPQLDELEKEDLDPKRIERSKEMIEGRKRSIAEWEQNLEEFRGRSRELMAKRREYASKEFPKLSKCKTADDVSGYLIGKGYYQEDEDRPNCIDFDRCPVSVAKNVAKRVDKFFEDYPEFKGKFKGITCVSAFDMPKGRGNSMACAGYDGVVSLNNRYYSNAKKLRDAREGSVRCGYAPVGTENPDAIIDHEYAHEVEHILNEELKKRGDSQKASDIIMDRVSRRINGGETDEKKEDYLRSQMSGYAYENDGVKHEFGKIVEDEGYGRNTEFLAEAISEARMSGNPRRLAVMVQEEFNKLIKGVLG